MSVAFWLISKKALHFRKVNLGAREEQYAASEKRMALAAAHTKTLASSQDDGLQLFRSCFAPHLTHQWHPAVVHLESSMLLVSPSVSRLVLHRRGQLEHLHGFLEGLNKLSCRRGAQDFHTKLRDPKDDDSDVTSEQERSDRRMCLAKSKNSGATSVTKATNMLSHKSKRMSMPWRLSTILSKQFVRTCRFVFHVSATRTELQKTLMQSHFSGSCRTAMKSEGRSNPHPRYPHGQRQNPCPVVPPTFF